MRKSCVCVAAGMIVCGMTGSLVAQGPRGNGYSNLQILPEDISRDELGDIMVRNMRALGLPRLGGEGCLYCHVGDMDVPRRKWDFASDANPMKEKARVMMSMVDEINSTHLEKFGTRIDSTYRVDCMSCHLGRTDPRPLPDVLTGTYEEQGIGATVEQFKALQEQYEGSQAYDFRAGTLSRVANGLARDGKVDDAIVLARLNVEVLPESVSAWQGLLFIEMEQAVHAGGVDAVLALLDSRESEAAPGSVTNGLIDALAWRLIRSERESLGHALVDANVERYPGEYRPLESKAFVLDSTDRKEEAIALLEGWIAGHPDHSRAKNLLVNLQEE